MKKKLQFEKEQKNIRSTHINKNLHHQRNHLLSIVKQLRFYQTIYSPSIIILGENLLEERT